MSETPQQTFYFGAFHIPADVDLLYNADAVVALEPRAVRVLRYLAEHHDRVVSKEELLDAVWPDVFTTDGVLKRAISQARRALGDDADQARFIATYHGRGYRLITPVSSASRPAAAKLSADSDEAPQAINGEAARPALEPGERISPDKKAESWPNNRMDPDYNQLIGREADLAALYSEYRRTLEGRGSPLLITGEAGVGKSQLAREFTRWAREQGALCLFAKFFDYQANHLAPYEVFLDLLRTSLEGRAGQRKSEMAQGDKLRHLIEEQLGVALPEELFVDSAASESRMTMTAFAGDDFRAVAPISQCFVRLSLERPLVIVIDDLQSADRASLELIGYLLRTVESDPLMIIALARAQEASDPQHPLAKWLRGQANYRSYTSLALMPLDEPHCQVMLEAVFGGPETAPKVAPDDMQMLCRVTGGNPYFLTEILRLLVARGAISPSGEDDRGWQWNGIKDLQLPDTIIMAAKEKLDRLSPQVRELAEQASVIGDEFRVDTLAHMSELGEEEVERLIGEGVDRGVLSERGLSAGEDCRFYHTTLRRVLYEGLSPRRRKRLHAKAAKALEVVYAREADRVAEAISTHYEAAGDLLRTFQWSMRAWQAASSRWNWSEAIPFIERAHRIAREIEAEGNSQLTPADGLRVLLGLGESFYSVGRLKESEAVLADAVSLARLFDEQEAVASALLRQGQTRIGLSLYREATEATEQAVKIYRQLNNPVGESLALIQLSNIQVGTGNYEMAAKLAGQALERASADRAVSAVASGLLGWARTLQGRYREGVPLLEQSINYFDRLGDIQHRAHLLRRLHWAHLSRGQYEAAISLAERAREDFRRMGDIRDEAKLNMGIGQARVGQGLYQEGIELLTQAREQFRLVGEAHMEAESLWLLGRAYCETGQYDTASASLARSLILVRAVGDRDDEFRVLTDAARLAIAERDYEGALRAADEAIAIARQLHNRDGLGAALVERSRACLQLSQTQEALDSAERAINLLDETESGERWRGYWALAQALSRANEETAAQQQDRALDAMSQCVSLLEDVRDQLDISDVAKRTAITRARSAPARDLYTMLLERGRQEEAEVISRRWLLGDGDAPHLSLVGKRA